MYILHFAQQERQGCSVAEHLSCFVAVGTGQDYKTVGVSRKGENQILINSDRWMMIVSIEIESACVLLVTE